MNPEFPTLFIGIAVAVILILWSSIRVLKEYERGVVFRLGRLIGAKGPGLFLLIPIVDKMVRVDLRVVTMSVERQELMTRDNVPATVDAVLYFRIVSPNDAVTKVENFVAATSMISQTTLRSVIGQSELDDLLSHRDKINQSLQQIIDQQTEPWGVKVSAVEVRDVALPDSMKRAMARQAEVERERRAKVINAEGEFQASQRLAEAAAIMSKDPTAIQLRFLQTLSEISSAGNSNTIVPVPIDLFTPFLRRAADKAAEPPSVAPLKAR
jgi:regulator of protease activity HflC (stomatin/prohibitin superfamily)